MVVMSLILTFSCYCHIISAVQPTLRRHRRWASTSRFHSLKLYNSREAEEQQSSFPNTLYSLAEALRTEPSGLQRAQAVVRLGDAWASEQQIRRENIRKKETNMREIEASIWTSPFIRVPGCVAVVHVSVTLQAVGTLEDVGDGNEILSQEEGVHMFCTNK